MKRLLLNVFLLSTLLFLVACGADTATGEDYTPVGVSSTKIIKIGDFGRNEFYSLYEYTADNGDVCRIVTSGNNSDIECLPPAPKE